MDRPLALHSSALSEAEYTAYSSIVSELIDGQGSTRRQQDESSEVPIGEARGWMRGKYGVDAGTIDQVCCGLRRLQGAIPIRANDTFPSVNCLDPSLIPCKPSEGRHSQATPVLRDTEIDFACAIWGAG